MVLVDRSGAMKDRFGLDDGKVDLLALHNQQRFFGPLPNLLPRLRLLLPPLRGFTVAFGQAFVPVDLVVALLRAMHRREALRQPGKLDPRCSKEGTVDVLVRIGPDHRVDTGRLDVVVVVVGRVVVAAAILLLLGATASLVDPYKQQQVRSAVGEPGEEFFGVLVVLGRDLKGRIWSGVSSWTARRFRFGSASES